MNNLIPLMRREWLQHRFGWMLMVLVPLAVAIALLSIGQIQLDDDMTARTPRELSLMLAALTVLITSAVLFLLLGVTSLFVAIGSPRRDHGDRSVEFWLSLPSGHAESLVAPMLVHLLLVPAAALALGLVAAMPVSFVVVGRVVGLGEWLALPWGTILAGLGSMALRVIAGLPLAVAWLLPLLLAAMLAAPFFARWLLPLLAVGVTLLSVGLERLLGQPLLAQALQTLGTHAATSLIGASGQKGFAVEEGADIQHALGNIPGWALKDFGVALSHTASPAMLGALVFAAALFAALVYWRRQGAGIAG
jgi:hypothetical protein